MTDIHATQNPYLPAPPADGQHVWTDGPTDLGGNHRCTLCGAYRGSDEAARSCRGQYAESGKMRSRAATRWIQDRLVGEGPARHIIRLNRSELGTVTRCGGSVRFGGTEHFWVDLSCGCTRGIEHDEWEAIHWGYATEARCQGTCPTAAAESNDRLNNRVAS